MIFKNKAKSIIGAVLLATAALFTFNSCEILAWSLIVAAEGDYEGTSSSGGTTNGGSTGHTGGTTSGGSTGSTGGTTSGGSTGSTGGTTSGGSTGHTGGTTSGGSTGGTSTPSGAGVTLPVPGQELSWGQTIFVEPKYFEGFKAGSQIRISLTCTDQYSHLLKMYSPVGNSGWEPLSKGKVTNGSVTTTGELTPSIMQGVVIYTVVANEAAHLKNFGLLLHGGGITIHSIEVYTNGGASSTSSSQGSSSSGNTNTSNATQAVLPGTTNTSLSWGSVITVDKSYFQKFAQGSQLILDLVCTDQYSHLLKMYSPVQNTSWQPLSSGQIQNASLVSSGEITPTITQGKVIYTVTATEATWLKNYGLLVHGGGITLRSITALAKGNAGTSSSSGNSGSSSSSGNTGTSSSSGNTGTSSSSGYGGFGGFGGFGGGHTGTQSSGSVGGSVTNSGSSSSSGSTSSSSSSNTSTTLYSGNMDLGNWLYFTIDASHFTFAQQGSVLTIQTTASPSLRNASYYNLRLCSNNNWQPLTQGTVTGSNRNGDTLVPTSPYSTINYTLTQADAQALKQNGLIIQGYGLAISRVTLNGSSSVTNTGTYTPTSTGVRTSVPPVTAHGALSVKGSNLVDQSGRKVQLYGMSTHGLSWYGDYVNYNAFKTLRDDWNTNCVRLALYPRDYNGYLTGGNKQQLLQYIYNGIDYATQLGMYVIVDWHVLNYNPNETKQEAIDFFTQVASRYRNYNNILYEICNEPTNSDWNTQIKPYAESVIPAIRAQSPNAIIIVGTNTWSQDVEAALSNPLTYKNIMYSFHFYANTHTQTMRTRLESVLRSGLPVFVTEFGTCDASGNGAFNSWESQQWFSLLDRYNVSYINWSLCNKAETASAIVSWSQNKYAWSDSELTDSGRLVKAQFLTRNR